MVRGQDLRRERALELLALGAILALAAVARFSRLDLSWFTRDQVRDLTAAAGIAAGREFPLLGPDVSLTGAHLGPLYYYLLSPAFLVSGHPFAPAWLLALVNTGAVALAYAFARRFFGRAVALPAAALFAVFPLAVVSGRGVWNPGFIPLFTLCFMWALLSLVVDGRARSLAWLPPLLAALVQFHAAAISLGAVAAILIALYRPPLRVRPLALGLGAAALLLAPYLAYELSHGLQNSRAMLAFAAADQGGALPRPLVPVFWSALTLQSTALGRMLAAYAIPGSLLAPFRMLYWLEAALTAAGLALCAYRAAAGARGTAPARAHAPLALLVLWFAVPLAALGAKKSPVFYWYLDELYPSQFLLAGVALASIRAPAGWPAWAGRTTRAATAAALAAIVAAQMGLLVAWERSLASRGEIGVRGTLDVSGVFAGAASAPPVSLGLIAYGYRAGVVRILLDDFGLPPGDFDRRVHGAVAGEPEENAYLLRTLGGDARARPADVPAAHYLVTTDGAPAPIPGALALRRAGPYAVVQYRPAIDRASWRYAVVGSDAAAPVWTPVAMPARGLRVSVGPGQRLVAAGTLRVGTERPTALGATAWGNAPLGIAKLRVDDRELAPTRHRERYAVTAWTAEAVFDLGDLAPGDHTLTLDITGPTDLLALDVYEGASFPAEHPHN